MAWNQLQSSSSMLEHYTRQCVTASLEKTPFKIYPGYTAMYGLTYKTCCVVASLLGGLRSVIACLHSAMHPCIVCDCLWLVCTGSCDLNGLQCTNVLLHRCALIVCVVQRSYPLHLSMRVMLSQGRSSSGRYKSRSVRCLREAQPGVMCSLNSQSHKEFMPHHMCCVVQGG